MGDENTTTGDENPICTLRDYSKPSHEGYRNTIELPVGNNVHENALTNFDSYQEKRLSSLRTQLRQQQDDIIRKINLLWKTVFEKLNDAPISESAGNSMALENIASISHIKREELRIKGIKSPSKLVFLNKEIEAEEGETTTDITPKHSHNITKKARGEVKEVMEEDKSKVETDWEVEEILEEEEEDEDGEYFNSFPTMEELT
ncbi:hypothetical protein Tco_1486293, partial [Tanacetum coccineum]